MSKRWVPTGGEQAFITEDAKLPTGDGALTHWTIAIKDNIDVEGMITTGGTRFLADNRAVSDAEAVARLRSAGATIIGKSKMHELGHGITGVNPSYGNTVHPADPRRTVGGSSGGSALAVLQERVRAALGTDTGGSARIPAAFTGLVGFRPSAGRYADGGVLHISPTRDTIGVIATKVSDVRVLDAVLSECEGECECDSKSAGAGQSGGADEGTVQAAQHEKSAQRVCDPPRIGVLAEARDGLSDALREVFDTGLELLAQAGWQIVQLENSRSLDRYFELGITVLRAETIDAIADYLAAHDRDGTVHELIACSESPDVRAILESAVQEPVNDENYRAALEELAVLSSSYREELLAQGVQVVVYPTTSVEPPLLTGPADNNVAEELRNTVLLSTPATLAGTPAISLPNGISAATGLPAGLTFEHLGGADTALLQLAEAAELPLKGIL